MALARLKTFVQHVTDVVDAGGADPSLTRAITPLLAELIAHDDWLPETFAQPHPAYYQQYLLHCDPLERFSVVSFVWGPGQSTPVHDHTVWGLIGMLRGEEIATPFVRVDAGLQAQPPLTLRPGDIDVLLPEQGDLHQVRNAFHDRVSISIHVYGANIGRVQRHVFDPVTGVAKDFISGFSSPVLPNLWG